MTPARKRFEATRRARQVLRPDFRLVLHPQMAPARRQQARLAVHPQSVEPRQPVPACPTLKRWRAMPRIRRLVLRRNPAATTTSKTPSKMPTPSNPRFKARLTDPSGRLVMQPTTPRAWATPHVTWTPDVPPSIRITTATSAILLTMPKPAAEVPSQMRSQKGTARSALRAMLTTSPR